MLIKVKNRTPHAILLRNATGDTVQLNGNTIKEIDNSFLIDYDVTAIQLIQPKPAIQTEVQPKTENVDLKVTQNPKSNKPKNS